MFVLDTFPLNLLVSMLGEIVFSFVGGGFELAYSTHKTLVETEFAYLSQHYRLDRIERVIVVGAGAIPYSAILLNRRIRKPTYAVERNPVAYVACVRLLTRLGLQTIMVVKGIRETERYIGGFENSLVLITLQTRLKEEAMRQILSNRTNTIVVIRIPSGANIRLFEGFDPANQNLPFLEHENKGVRSVFISDRTMQLPVLG
jgi:hypothetical protein